MQTLSPPRSAPRQGANLRAFARLLWRRRLAFVLALLFVAAVVATGVTVADRSYTASARIAASPADEFTNSPVDYAHLLGTLADVAESRPVLEEVARSVPGVAVSELRDAVQGSVVSGTVLVQVAVTDGDPARAAQIANAIVTALPAHAPRSAAFTFAVTEPAVVPASFTSPNLKVILLAGGVLALGLALVAAVLADRFFRTVDTAEEVGEATGLGLLGVLPRPDDAAGVPAADRDSPDFSSLRALRVALEFASSEEPTRSLVVASAADHPWSGWLEVNLAVSLAEVGHRVLLIDADRHDGRRHPALAAADHPGLYDLLEGSATFAETTVAGPVEGVTVLPLGNPDYASPSLLEMRFRALVEGIDAQYDVVLIHAAPVTESDDARIMAIDGSLLLTVPAGRVKQEVLAQAATGLSDIGTRVLGTVLLGARRPTARPRSR